MNTYTTTTGTEPNADEQHEARTIVRERQDGTYMMTEIGDGVFVQWSTCLRCKGQVEECTCPEGPEEPGYIHRWRINRFAKSFTGRGVEPALPEILRDRDRRVNAVTRYLLNLGYTIEAPETKSEIPDFDEADYAEGDEPAPTRQDAAWDTMPKHDPEGPEGWIKDTCDHCEAGSGELCHDGNGKDLKEPHRAREQAWNARRAYERNPGDYQGPVRAEWVAESPASDAVSERVDAGMDSALETLRARAQEDKSDVGF